MKKRSQINIIVGQSTLSMYLSYATVLQNGWSRVISYRRCADRATWHNDHLGLQHNPSQPLESIS